MIASEDLELVCTVLWILFQRGHLDVYLDFSESVNAMTLSPNKQDELLLPFKTLFTASSIIVKGAINQNLAAEVQDAPLKFISMSAVELLELMRSLRREGEQYQKAGNFRRGISCLEKGLDVKSDHETIRGLCKPESGGPWPSHSIWAALAIEYFRTTSALSIMHINCGSWGSAYKENYFALKAGSDLQKSWLDCPIGKEEMESLEHQRDELRVKLAADPLYLDVT